MAPTNNTNHTFSFPQASLSLCDDHSERLGRLDDALVRMVESQASMRADLKHTLATCDRIEARLDSMLETLDRSAAGLSAVDSRVDSLESDIRATKKTLWGALVAILASGLVLVREFVSKKLGL